MIKKEFRQKLFVGFSTMVFAFMFVSSFSMVTYASGNDVAATAETNADDDALTRSAIIEYRYKFEGTKVYRRLYNYTEQCWVGDWEYVGEGYIEPGM